MKDQDLKKTIIFILGGFAKKGPDGRWHTADQYEGYNQFGTNGHRIRILAGYYLHRQHPRALLIASGGKGQLSDQADMPPISQIMRAELSELGVPAGLIREENQSGNTYQQLVNLREIAKQENAQNVLIASNEYHLPRVQAFLDCRPELRDSFQNIDYRLISADAEVSRADAKLKQIIEKTYASPEMATQIALEQKGIVAIKNGTYKFI